MRKIKVTDIIIGIIFTLFIISFGVITTLNFRCLYYLDIDLLNIVHRSGLDKETIIKNYNALIDYNSPLFKGDLKLPDFSSSLGGLQHFVDVKNIFTAFYAIAGTTLILCGMIIIYKKAKKDYSYLKVSAITVLIIPVIALIACVINFDATFVIFHKIFFRNDLWIFNPSTDPVITILPDTFFLHALIFLILFIFLGSLILFLTSCYLRAREIK